MKILIAGNWHSELHEEPVFNACKNLGHTPERFRWHPYFQTDERTGIVYSSLAKAQFKYMLGPIVDRVNHDLVDKVAQIRPDIVFVYRGILIYPKTLQRIKQVSPATILIGYNNDDPFSPLYPKWKWRHFLAGIPCYDLLLAYRTHNLEEFRRAGAKRVEVLRSWFIPEVNRPVQLSRTDREKYECDVVFIGHYENDGRLACLEEIVRRGWKLKIFGHDYGWHRHILRSDVLRSHYPLTTLWGEEYNKAICGAKVALCFFSKLNRDTYTRRCFEIPAAGTLLLSEFSADLAGLFIGGKEADYFGNVQEMVEKLEIYLNNDELRRQVAQAGHRRVYDAGHDVTSRMAGLFELLANEGYLHA